MAEGRTFSPSKGWDEVRALLTNERSLLVALGGAFFLLPSLALSFILPAPAEATLQALAQAIAPYFPIIFLVSIVQLLGQATVWTLVMAEERLTVGQAIAASLQFLPFYFVINVCANIAIGIGLALLILPGLYLAARLAPVGAIAVAERHRWPVSAFRRSFEVTKGNALPVFAFLLIVGIVYLIVSMVASIVFGSVFALAGLDMQPGGIGSSLLSVVSGIISATGSVIFTLMQVAIYRQLTGADKVAIFS